MPSLLGVRRPAGLRHVRSRGGARLGLLTLAAGLLLGCAKDRMGGDALPAFVAPAGIAYTTTLDGVPSEALEAVLRDSLRLFTYADRPPGSLERLRRRAETDIETARTVLRSEGYYAGEVELELEELPAEGAATVLLRFLPGPRFTLERLTFVPPAPQGVPLPAPADLGLTPGVPAASASIVAAETRAVAWLRDRGFPYARFGERRAVADLTKTTLEVTSTLVPGPRVRYGELEIEGLTGVDADYVRSYRRWDPEGFLSRRDLDEFQRSLTGTGLFELASVEVAPQEELAASGGERRIPVRVRVEEAKHRSFGAGARFSSDDGPGVNAYVEHRNSFGANETARLTGTVALSRQALELFYRKPQFLRDRQSLLGEVSLRREDNEAFEETAFEAELGIQRSLTDRLKVGIGISGRIADITSADRTGRVYLLGLPLAASYDASDDLLDPTRGFRLRSELTPYTGAFADETLAFSVLDLGGSFYQPLTRDRRHVIALRARLGTIFGAERSDVPPPQRLYAGGGGSVRGYKTKLIGPLDAVGDPLGGRGVAEAGIELRSRITENLGLVPFFEAGVVSVDHLPTADDDIQYAVGLGVRYYTLIGPLRVDLGFPINPRDEDDVFQFYVSIGQAF